MSCGFLLRAVTGVDCGSRVRDVSTRREANERIGGIVERDLDSRVAVGSREGSSFLSGVGLCCGSRGSRELQ